MKRICLLLAVGLLVLPTPAHAEDPGVHQTLINAQAPTVVSVKMVLAISGTFRGQSIEQEGNASATGVVVDASGLIMLSADGFGGNARMRALVQDLKVVPTNIRVIFPGDEKEYDAILGAKDTKLGLAFILIKELKERTATPVDFSKTAAPTIGQTLYGVTRMGQGFDHAPMCDVVRVTGEITKPRKAWVLAGAGPFGSKPLFDAKGNVAGIVVNQEGVGDNAQSRICLLPLGIAQARIKQSLKASQTALEEALEAEAEAAEAAKEDEEAKKADDAKDDDAKADDAKKADAPKDEPKKDAPKDEPKKDGV